MIRDQTTRVKLTHKPSGESVMVAVGSRSMARSFTQARVVAKKFLAGKIAATERVDTNPLRTYDLTPGFQRIRGGGIFTTDPAEIEAIIHRGEIPLKRWAVES
jgi:hypothetical protein